MTHVITSNDTSINIKYIDDEESHYQLNIPNNDINKKLIENTVFKFDKYGSVIIMQYDIHVFQLNKIECKYSDYIKMQNKLEHLKNENDILNNKITDKNQLQQQLNIYYEEQIDQLKKELNNNNDLIQQQIKILKDKSIADKKEVILLKQELSKNEKEMVNFKNDLLQEMKKELNNNNVLIQQQIKILKDKSIADKKEVILLKQELSDTNKLLTKQIEKVHDKSVKYTKDTEQLNNDLQQQINSTSYYQPVVFFPCNVGGMYQYYGDEQHIFQLQHKLSAHYGLLNLAKFHNVIDGPTHYYNHKILIPPKKTVILFKNSIEIYSSGIHKNIEGCTIFWCGKEDDKDEFINTLKNIGYNCDNIIKY